MDKQRFGWRVRTCVEREPGSGGKFSARYTIANLAGYDAGERQARTAKHIAWQSFAAQVQAENVYIVTGSLQGPPAWNYAEFIHELDQLSGDPRRDGNMLRDCADAASGAFNELLEENDTRALLCSGEVDDNADDDGELLTDDQLKELPDEIGDIIRSIRGEDERFERKRRVPLRGDDWFRD